jgi:hypothetical protein
MTNRNFLHKAEVLAFFVNWFTIFAPVAGDYMRHTGMGAAITALLKRRLR